MDIHLTNSTGRLMMVKRGIYSRTPTQKIASTLGTGFLAAFITDSNVTGERTVHTPMHLTTKAFVIICELHFVLQFIFYYPSAW